MDDSQLHNSNIIRLHEKWMDFTEKRLDYLEKRMNQIPWILLMVAINVILSLVAMLSKYIK